MLKKANNINAILFDMVGVLLFEKNGYIPRTKAEINAHKIEQLYNHVDDKKLLVDIKNKYKLTDSEIKEALPFIPKKYEKYSPIWKILPAIKKKYLLAIINNGNALAHKHWHEQFDYSIFNFFINSTLVGIKKPDPGIFLITCKKLKVKPQNCLFMDDKEENIIAAKNLGMETIWWNPLEIDKQFALFKSLYL